MGIAKAITIMIIYSIFTNDFPNRTANVRLPDFTSVSASRKLFTISIAVDNAPNGIPNKIDSLLTTPVCKKYVPDTAMMPKNKNTNKSPHPWYPSG